VVGAAATGCPDRTDRKPPIVDPSGEGTTSRAYARLRMETTPVIITFPASPEYLRLARDRKSVV